MSLPSALVPPGHWGFATLFPCPRSVPRRRGQVLISSCQAFCLSHLETGHPACAQPDLCSFLLLRDVQLCGFSHEGERKNPVPCKRLDRAHGSFDLLRSTKGRACSPRRAASPTSPWGACGRNPCTWGLRVSCREGGIPSAQVAVCTPIQWVLFAGLGPGGDRRVVLGMAGAGDRWQEGSTCS